MSERLGLESAGLDEPGEVSGGAVCLVEEAATEPARREEARLGGILAALGQTESRTIKLYVIYQYTSNVYYAGEMLSHEILHWYLNGADRGKERKT
jgi:hypothetical protein